MLPKALTPFIGRHQEMTEIGRLLADPDCRLLTLVGPGGIGKSRLALAVADRVKRHFADGAAFVPLQAVTTAEFLVTAIADALTPSWSGQDDPQTQLFNYLHDKTILLLLDNFEQLRPAAGLLTGLLHAAPGVKLLVTSRETLNRQEEWLYPVPGLSVPSPAMADWASHDAVQLFAGRARQVWPNFSPAAEANRIVDLCRLVEGTPLALEMAAAWLKSLTLAEVVAELQNSLDFLTSSQPGLPERHRSMRLIFDHTWQRLTTPERTVFRQLSLFRGGFTREAATAVAGASLPILAALVDKSLLRREDNGRYHIHELLRQFAAEHLAADSEAYAAACDRRAAYYNRFLGDRFAELIGGEQEQILAEIGGELDNVRAAWQWAAQQGSLAELEYAAMSLHTFYQFRGRFQEGAEAFVLAVAAAEKAPSSLARDRALAFILTCAGWLEMRFGRVEQATQMQQRALALYAAHDLLPAPGAGTDPLTALTILAVTAGQFTEALHLGRQAWQRGAARNDAHNMAYAGYGLTSALLAQGNYDAALIEAQAALAQAQTAGNRWLMAFLYNQLGQIHQALDQATSARHYYQAAYAIREGFDDPAGMALSLNHLGELALAEGNFQQAHDLYAQSISLYQKLGDRGGLARAFYGLGIACARTGGERDARRYFEQALRTAVTIQTPSVVLSLLVGIGDFFRTGTAPELGVTALRLAASHPAADQATRDRARQLLPVRAGSETGREIILEALIPLLLGELTSLEPTRPTAATVDSQPTPSSLLVDPLSQRELEVLQGIAVGLRNQEIADQLVVGLSTVKTHINNIYSKLGVTNRVQALERARALNLLQ
jgi:predicted ATPase/DNA-binding CsgD family transcriptional regulator